jgi:Zn-dependent oligopeptidase
MNPTIGMKYRKTILAPGGTRDSIDSLTEFLGREPNIDAYLEMRGFTESGLKESVESVPLYHN